MDATLGTSLVVVAHPDDEVLGIGATAARISRAGGVIRACILSGGVGARTLRPSDEQLQADIEAASALLGMQSPLLSTFPNIGMNAVPHLRLVQHIERAILEVEPAHIFTHHPADLNDDHRQVSLACQAAARLPLRRTEVKPVASLHFMEVLSSTDWALPGQHPAFQPTTFIEIGESLLDIKIEALRCYTDVMRPYPHPRSPEVVKALATYRGGQAGMHLAESFQTVYQDGASLLGL